MEILEKIDKVIIEKKDDKKIKKAWNEFEKVARKELGPDWDGKVHGDMIYGDGLSKKAKALYMKYFNLL